jgi:hypothetical protein
MLTSHRIWSENSLCPLPHARTSLQAQVNDKSGSLDPLLGPDCTHPYIYICEIATHDTLSPPPRLRGLALVVLQQTAANSSKAFRASLWAISANVALFGIGQQQPAFALGSQDAVLCGQIFVPQKPGARPLAGAKLERNGSPITCCCCLMLWAVPWKKFLVYGSGDVSKHASPNHSRASLNLIVEPELYMLLRRKLRDRKPSLFNAFEIFDHTCTIVTIERHSSNRLSAGPLYMRAPRVPGSPS